MNKEQILSLLDRSIASGMITKEEISNFCAGTPSVTNPSQNNSINNPESHSFGGKNRFSATNILYTIGGLIVLIGIGTLLFRFWSDLSSIVRITLTLGIAIAAYISGILLRSNNQSVGIAVVMQVIGAVLAPIGIFIALYESGIQDIAIGWITSVAVLLAIVYIFSLVIFRSIIFSFFSIVFSTWALYSGVAYALSGSSIISSDIYKYLTLAVGIGYLFLSSYVKKTSHYALSRTLDFFGSVGIFSAILVLSDFKPNQSALWEIIGILCLFGGLYLSSASQNKTIFKTTSLFIIIFIIKFTGEYFVDSFGWPIALIIGGLILIGVGDGLVKFNKNLVIHTK